MKRIISLFLCLIMCISFFSSTIVQVSAIGAADKIFTVNGSLANGGKITYTVGIKGGVEGFGGAAIRIEFDSTVLKPAEFSQSYSNTGTPLLKGTYANGITPDENVYAVVYTNSSSESFATTTDFFTITFDIIDDERPNTKVYFKCREYYSVTDPSQSITPADGCPVIAALDVTTLEAPKLVGATIQTNAIKFQWQEAVGAVSYEIKRRTLAGTWEDSIPVSGDQLEYIDTELESGLTYVYTVRAVNALGQWSIFTPNGVSCKYVSKPSNIMAENDVDGVQISWDLSSGANTYVIMRREYGTQEWQVLTVCSSDKSSYKDTTVVSGKTYEYDVNATLGAFITDTASEGDVVTHIKTPPDFLAENTGDGIKLSWEYVDGALYYILYRREIGKDEGLVILKEDNYSNTYLDKDVEFGKMYTYSIQAVSATDDKSAYSKTGLSIVRVPSTVVTQLVAQAYHIDVYFEPVSDVDGYNIYRKTEDSDWVKAGSAPADAVSFKDVSAESGKEYYYCVVPLMGVSESQKIPSTETVYYLRAPKNVTAVNVKDGIKVTWEHSAGAEEYSIYRKESDTTIFKFIGKVSADKTEFLDKNVSVDEIYSYYLFASNDIKDSENSVASPEMMRVTSVKGVGVKRTASGIMVDWDWHKKADSYIVLRKTTGAWVELANIEAVKYHDTTAASGVAYSYAIIPVVESYRGGIDENEIKKITYIAPPKITGATNSKNSTTVTWNAVTGAQKYILQRVLLNANGTNNGSYKDVATLSGKTSYEDKGVASGATYKYRVYALIGSEKSVASSEYTSTFMVIPKIKSLKNAYGGIKVSWSASKGAAKYRIYRKVSGGNWSLIKTVSSSVTAYTDKTAENGVTYYYAIRAEKGNSLSTYASKSHKYYASPVVTVANTTSAITVSWKKISGTKSYYVYRKEPGDKSWKKVSTVTKNIYTDKNVKAGKTYKYTVKAYNGKIFSGYKTSGWSIRRLAPPKLKSIANYTNGVYLKWGKVKGATRYKVYRKTSITSWTEIGTVKGSSFTDKTAEAGKIYTYTVVATYSKSRSTYIAKGLKIKRLKRPGLDKVKSTKKGVKFTWKDVKGASGYLVYRKTGSKGKWKEIAKVSGKSTKTYLDKTAKKGKTYYYSVRAYSGSYKSMYNKKGLKVKDKY